MELIGKKPERRVLIYFLTAIIFGAVLLSLPLSAGNTYIRPIDALFTSTSAVCVTGLTVLDTGADFSLFGQIVILFLIQIGGLGIMTLASVLLARLVPQLSFLDRMAINGTLGSAREIKPKTLLKAVIFTTLGFELLGAVALFIRFCTRFPIDKAVYYSVFHSVSAFCNAGFSPFSNSLEDFTSDISVLLIISFLIICGGLGFIVIAEIIMRIRTKSGKLSLHSRLCLSMTGILLAAGTVIFLVIENDNAFSHVGVIKSTVNAFFQAVTCRTAGFNAIPQINLSEISLLITMIFMFIGACPGSTGGGVKTTTISAVFLLAYNRFRGRQYTRAFNKSIGNDSINRANTVILVAMTIIVLMFVILMFAEEKPLPHKLTHGWFVESAFEVISAFGTVGLSLGVTPHLHDGGKIILIILMFLGRVGLLTLVYSLASPVKAGEVVYLEEEIMIG